MAQSFRMTIRRSNERLTLHLEGDFDGSSALELINAIKNNALKSKDILIDTSRLVSVHPFGQETLRRHYFRLNGLRSRIRIGGIHRDRLHPDGWSNP
ncbi:MAG: hypothetical protein ACOWWM_11975 [Desulfobacterales bacterium]